MSQRLCRLPSVVRVASSRLSHLILLLVILTISVATPAAAQNPANDPNIELEYTAAAPYHRPVLLVTAEDLTDVTVGYGSTVSLTVTLENPAEWPVENVGIGLHAAPTFATSPFPVGTITGSTTITATIPMVVQELPTDSVYVGVNVAADGLINPLQTGAWVSFSELEPQEGRNLASVDDPVAWEPTFYDPVPSLFTGAATYDFPFFMPPGPGGFTPSLGLVYNGGTANGAVGKQQANYVGYGWHLAGLVEVTQPLEICNGDEVCPVHGNADERFTLSFDGASYQLIRTDPGSAFVDTYRVEGHAGLYAEYCDGTYVSQACKDADDSDDFPDNGKPDSAGHRSNGFWLVKGPDGSTYRLGYLAHSEQEIYQGSEGGAIGNYKAMTWRVDKAQDRHGNAITYSYSEYSTPPHVPSSYLTSLEYGFNRITLANQTITDPNLQGHGDEESTVTWHTHRLATVTVEAKDYEVPGSFHTLRSYHLSYIAQRFGDEDDPSVHQHPDCADVDYDSSPYDHWMLGLLTSIVEKGSDGLPRATMGGLPLPTVEFLYDWRKTSLRDIPDPHQDILFCYPYLHEIHLPLLPSDNGNPNIIFDYVGGPVGLYGNLPGGLANAWANPVTSKMVDGGWASVPFTLTYAYSNPDYQGEDTRLQGFKKVIQTDSLGTRWVENNFLAYHYDSANAVLTGRLYVHITREGNGEPEPMLKKVYSNWVTRTINLPNNVLHQPELEREETVLYDREYPSKQLITKLFFDYDDYGNRTKVYEYGAGSVPYRTSETRYVYNTTPDGWLVNLPWLELLWAGADGTGTLLRQTRYRYDEWNCNVNGSWVPAEGLLTATDSWLTGYNGGTCNDWITTSYEYGTTGSAEDWQLTKTLHPGGGQEYLYWQNDTILEFTRTVADGVQYDTVYDFDSTFPWQPNRILQPNGAEFKYSYEHFGRLTHTYTPDPTTGNARTQPTMQVVYHDGEAPFHIDTISVPQQSGLTQTTRRFYDGLGRVQQERTWDVGLGTQDTILIGTQHDGWGRTICQTTAIKTGWKIFNEDFVCGSSSYDRILSEYDALDRPTLTTSYDGDVNGYVTGTSHLVVTDFETGNQTHHYMQEVEDANQHIKAYIYNTFGELMRVREYINNTDYADTEYRYDVAGNLTLVESREAHDDGIGTLLSKTVMSYDELGRKTSMTDADMGTWTYSYDAAGNLVNQTDAEGQKICFYYDQQNRPVRQIEDSTPTNACPSLGSAPGSGPYHLSSTTYLISGFGKGQVGSVSWGSAPADNSEQFSYDARGRVTNHTREIDGITYSMATTSFDMLDRPLTVTYPDSETVTMSYDRQGIDTLTAGADGLVTDVLFNERGQMTDLYRQNGRHTSYEYFGGSENYALERVKHGNILIFDAMPNFTYTYDGVGNILAMQESSTTGPTQLQSFTYDDLNRLVDASAPAAGSIPAYDHDYAYDRVGNMTNYAGKSYHYSDDPVDQPHAVRAVYDADTSSTLVIISVWSEAVCPGPQCPSPKPQIQVWVNGELETSITPALTGNTMGYGLALPLSGDDTLALVMESTQGFDYELLGLTVDGQTVDKAAMVWDGEDAWDGDMLQRGDMPAYFTEGGYHYVRGEGQHFAYDHNGNMTLRLEAGAAYQQQFDVQNRLVSVNELFSGDNTTFAYDAAGQRVKTIRPDSAVIHYPFPTYERELPREDPGSITSVQDATVFSGLPTTNYGEEETLVVGQTELHGFSGPAMEYWRSLLRFDLSSIPAGATLNSATLTLTCQVTIGASLDMLVSPLSLGTSEWTEDSVTWSNQPTAGSSPQTNQVMSGSSYTQYQIDVLAFVQAWHSGTLSNNGFQLRGAPTGTERLVECLSSEFGSTVQRPKLAVDWELPEVTRSTYSLGGQVVAVRVAGHTDSSKNGLFYLHTDHLGSNSVMTKANGDLVADSVSRYYPYGDWRTEPAAALTDIGYTGHKHNNTGSSDLGLIYMNARYYVVGVGRFASADTLVPDPTRPQSFNRYSYVRNNPLNRMDPTGHIDCAALPKEDNLGCRGLSADQLQPSNLPPVIAVGFKGFDPTNAYHLRMMGEIRKAAQLVGQSLAVVLQEMFGVNLTARQAFLLVYGGTVTFEWTGASKDFAGETIRTNLIEVYDLGGGKEVTNILHWAIHELGHAFNRAIGGQAYTDIGTFLKDNPSAGRPRGDTFLGDRNLYGFAGNLRSPLMWQHSPYGTNGEQFADMFLGWVFNQWEPGPINGLSPEGDKMSSFMNASMKQWLSLAVSN